MGLGAIVVPVTIGLSSGIGADALPGAGTLLGGAVLTRRTSAPVLGATLIVASGHSLVGG